MDYELCKKLKDLGFPQEDFGYTGRHHHKQGDVCYKPTLSELIEACGENFDELQKRQEVYFAYGASKTRSGMSIKPFLGSGKTPEESVATLWIEINKDAVKE